MAIPIFVLGKQRSGTTWLANQLCEHPQIAGVQHEQHHGIHESKFFANVYGRYGDLSQKRNYMEFVEVISTSDYFRLVDATKEYLYSLYPATYEEVFRAVMDRFAEARGCSHWVEKSPTHSPLGPWLAERFPDATFVSIIRDPESTVSSSLGMAAWADPRIVDQGGVRRSHIVRTVAKWRYYNKVILKLARRSGRNLVLGFDELRGDTEATLRRVCEFLDLPFDPAILNQTYAPNRSAGGGADEARVLSGGETALVRVASAASRLVPVGLYRVIERRMARARGHVPLPGSSFRLHPFASDAGEREPTRAAGEA